MTARARLPRPAAAAAAVRAPSTLGPAHGRGRRRRRRAAGAGARRAGAAGRCSPSRPAARAPGDNAIRCYRLLLGGRSAAEVERVVVFGHPTLSPPGHAAAGRATTSRCSRRRARGAWTERPFPVAQHARRPAGGRGGRRLRLARRAGGPRTDASAPPLDALLAAEPDLTPYEVAGAVARALPAGGLLVVGASSPIRDLDLMVPRTRSAAAARSSPTAGSPASTARSRTAIGAALGRPTRRASFALMGDVTFLHDTNGLVLGPARARARPDDRGRQRRRRLDLRDARAGRAGVRRPLTSGSSARPTASTWPACAPPPAPRTGGSSRCPSSSRRWPRPTAASRSSRCGSAATTAASSTRASGRLAQH